MTANTWEFDRYRVALRQGDDIVMLETRARDFQTARMIVCYAEKAPLRSVLWTERLPD